MIPIEWLRELIETRDGYRRLLEEEGSLSAAAHRLARTKCMTRERSTTVPTGAAARIIAREVPGLEVPDTKALVRDCELLGLGVM